MEWLTIWFVNALIAGLLLMACDGRGQPHTLASGTTIRLLSAGAVEDSFTVEYCTQYPHSDRRSLAGQADEVLGSLRAPTGLKRAYVWPTACYSQLRWAGWHPVIISDQSTAFTYHLGEDGHWSRDK